MEDRRDREAFILSALARNGQVQVSGLAVELGVSEVTIRSQLRDLELRGLLSRIRGGAQAASIHHVLEREREHEAEKDRIAAAAAELVHDDDRIMIEAGTTAARLVRHLANRRGVQIVTNSTLAFQHARHNPGLSVILTGGTFHRESESLVGPVALRAIRGFNVRLAFVGTDGLSPARGLTTQFAEGAEVITAMHDQSDETWLLADSSKLGRTGFVSVLRSDQLTGLITDTGMAEAEHSAISELVPTVRAV